MNCHVALLCSSYLPRPIPQLLFIFSIDILEIVTRNGYQLVRDWILSILYEFVGMEG